MANVYTTTVSLLREELLKIDPPPPTPQPALADDNSFPNNQNGDEQEATNGRRRSSIGKTLSFAANKLARRLSSGRNLLITFSQLEWLHRDSFHHVQKS